MSLPAFPTSDHSPTREEVINQIISSIAMEELGLSHIINAEGEKLQYALGTLEGSLPPGEALTIDELLRLNDSIRKTLDGTVMNQFLLKEKLMGALSASVMQGPTGPEGPQGPATIAVDPVVDRLEPGEAPFVRNDEGTLEHVILRFGIPRGATGEPGPQGEQGVTGAKGEQGVTGATGPMSVILDAYDSYEEFIRAHSTGLPGDMYLAGGVLYVWNEFGGTWDSYGDLSGATGPTGASAYEEAVAQGFTGNEQEWLESLQGEPGPMGAVLDCFESYDQLVDAHPTGSPGDSYLAGGRLYVWDEASQSWKDCGSLLGPTGPTGATGESVGTIVGVVEDESQLPATGQLGELYAVLPSGSDEAMLYVWNDSVGTWQQLGPMQGVIGPTGATGPVGVILDSYETLAELQAAHPTGAQGDSYLAGGRLYVWDETAWKDMGSLQGPEGSFDTGDALFTVSGQTGSAAVAFDETLFFDSETLSVEVSDNPATVHINAPGQTLQLNSVNPATVRAFGGGRSTVVAVGNGCSSFIDTNVDPVTVELPAISIKLPLGGTVTEVHYAFSTTENMMDASTPTVYGRLYKADSLSSKEFHYIPGSEVSFTVPYATPAGTFFTRAAHLTETVAPGSQLVILYHNTSSALGAAFVSGIMGGAVVLK